MKKLYSARSIKRHKRRVHRLKNHPFVVPVITLLVLFFLSLGAFVVAGASTLGASDTKVVSLFVDGVERNLPTRASTVGNLLERLDIVVTELDIVEPALSTTIEQDNFKINVYKARSVAVVDAGNKVVIVTAEPTPRKVAEKAGIKIFPEDNVTTQAQEIVNPTDVFNDGFAAEKVVIERATEVHLNLYGTQVSLRTHAQTIGDLLEEKKIQLREGDQVDLALGTPIVANIQVFVSRFGTEVETVEELIVAPVQNVDDFGSIIGTSTVRDPGSPGLKLVTYEVIFENDIETSRTAIQEVVIQQPLIRIVAIGRKVPVITGNKADLLLAAGIPVDQHFAADFIISHESTWRITARNSSSGAYGLCQALPGTKMASAGDDWLTNPVTQLKWCNSYAIARYGSWTRAYEIWQLQRWW